MEGDWTNLLSGSFKGGQSDLFHCQLSPLATLGATFDVCHRLVANRCASQGLIKLLPKPKHDVDRKKASVLFFVVLLV